MARPEHQPTAEQRRQVETLAGFGVTEDDIAKTIEISPPTLRKHYRRELDVGHIKANSAVAQSLYKKALGDGASAVTAAIFWLKTRAGWKETSIVEGPGPDGEHLHKIEGAGHRDALAHILARQAAAGTTDGGAGSTD